MVDDEYPALLNLEHTKTLRPKLGQNLRDRGEEQMIRVTVKYGMVAFEMTAQR